MKRIERRKEGGMDDSDDPIEQEEEGVHAQGQCGGDPAPQGGEKASPRFSLYCCFSPSEEEAAAAAAIAFGGLVGGADDDDEVEVEEAASHFLRSFGPT